MIGIYLVATNSYFILGLRFIKRFIHHYKGDSAIKFYFFSDVDPTPYLKDQINVRFFKTSHNNWVDGTNSKFKNILDNQKELLNDCEYLYYFDADTNITNDFNENWFIGDLVGGEHYGNKTFLSNGAGFERNPISKAYVPEDSQLPYTYYYGAFFGGKTKMVINFAKILRQNQLIDQEIPYEPAVNDESYINQYFHYHPPTKTVPTENFQFNISDKGGIGETRNIELDISWYKESLLKNPDLVFDLTSGDLIFFNRDNSLYLHSIK